MVHGTRAKKWGKQEGRPFLESVEELKNKRKPWNEVPFTEKTNKR